MFDHVKAALLAGAQAKRRAAEEIADDIARAGKMLVDAYRLSRKTIIFGNGGSAADAQHFAAELVGRFASERVALPSLALTVNTSTLTSVGNDYGYEQVFVRQIEAHTQPGDVVIGISTSGNSPNVLHALERARAMEAKTIGLTGRGGGAMPQACDVCVIVPHDSTARIQEVHIAILHIWCELIEQELFQRSPRD